MRFRKCDRAADGDWENCVRSQGAYFEGYWGVIVLCTMFLVSSSINVSIFHITWLDTLWTDLISLSLIYTHTHTHTHTLIGNIVLLFIYMSFIFNLIFIAFFHYLLVPLYCPQQSPHCCPCPWVLFLFCSISVHPNLPQPTSCHPALCLWFCPYFHC